MKKSILILFGSIVLASAFSSCTKEEFEPLSNSNMIKLYASTGTAKTDVEMKGSPTGTSGVINSNTQVEVPLAMVRLDQNLDTHYPSFLLTSNPISATLGLPDETSARMREITFENPQFFRNPTSRIKFASWGPWKDASGYTYTSDATESVATMPIDGQTDYIYGSISTGSKSESFNNIQYNHALIQYNIYVYAMVGEKQECDENGNLLYWIDGDDHSLGKTTTETDYPSLEEYNTADEWGPLENLKIEKMPTTCKITLPKDEEGNYQIQHLGNTSTIDFGTSNSDMYFNPVELPAGFENMVRVATCLSGSPESGMLKLSIKTEKSSSNKEVSIARNFKPGCAYDIYLRFSDHGFVNSSVQVSEWRDYGTEVTYSQSVDMYYNLSRYETANCYVINSGNYNYCFDGTKRGNGSDKGTINPGYVDIAWMDFDNTFVDKNGNTVKDAAGRDVPFLTLTSHSLSSGLVLLRVGTDTTNVSHSLFGKKGNAVIAAYDKDPAKGGTVIWSWHLWFSDRIYTYGVGSGYVMQDRNLGALKADGTSASTGLYYQWGRPTPLNMNEAQGYDTSTDQVSSPDKALAYINTFIGKGQEDWLTTKNDGLWGFVNERTNIQKSIYDPCPYGYYLPDRNVWDDIASPANFKSFSTTNGVKLEINGNTMWLPVTGYYNENATRTNYTGNDAAAYLWSGYIGTSSFYYFHDKTQGAADETTVRTRAMQLRCMAEVKEELITRDLSASQTANCYIISKDGYYKFNATVRGNGVGKVTPLGTTGVSWDISGGVSTTIKPDHAKILWWQGGFENYSKWYTTSNTRTDAQMKTAGLCLEVLDNGKLTDGYVNMKVSDFTTGNVIIAACDIADNILWTWHIWLTDKPADIDNGYYALMDRFLGATYAPDCTGTLSFTTDKNGGNNSLWATYGFLYQWGRKDPFCGAAVGSTTSNTTDSSPWWYHTSSNTWTKKTAITTSSGNSARTGTFALTCTNPTTFYKGSQQADANGEWVTAMTNGSDQITTALWGYAVHGNAYGRSFSKTMHDPCPPGYRTMLHSAGYLSPVNGDDYNTGSYLSGDYTSTYKGVVTNKNNAASPGAQGYYGRAWYPFAGQRIYNGNINAVQTSAYMVTGMPYGSYNTRSTYMNTSNHGQYRGSYGTSTAMSVRCQKE